ncbi:hypothetical protein V8F06_013320 [Rhypophila decipiens]
MAAAMSTVAPDGAHAENDRSMIRKSLGAALDAIEFTGSFAAFTKTKKCSVKPIFVDDVGFIKFPLPEATAQALIDKARQAPNGKGETFVNTSVCNPWELDTAQLHLNPKWAKVSDNALEWVAKSLGIPANTQIKAELNKMLVYGKEATVKAQTNFHVCRTEQISGVFGTFIVCLPSAHKGGDLVLKHRSSTKVFKTSHTRPSWACWFSDVSHEVLPVKSGLRIVLTYNLVISDRTDETLDELTSEDSGISERLDEPRLSAALSGSTPEEERRVQQALRAWLNPQSQQSGSVAGTITRELDYLCYALRHDYTDTKQSKLALDQLKGVDFDRIRCLQDACSSQNATVFLGILEKVERGECRSSYESHDSFQYWEDYLGDGEDDENWHEFIEVVETELTIKNIVSIHGKFSCYEVYIGEEDLQSQLIQYDERSDPFKGAHYAKEDGFDDCEPEYASAKHCYRMAVAIVVPNDLLDVFLAPNFDSRQAQSRLPEYLARCCEYDPQTRQLAMNMVRHLAEAAWSPRYNTFSLEGRDVEILMEVVNVVLQNNNYDLFRLVFSWMNERYENQLVAAVKEIIKKDRSFEFSHVKDSFLQALSAIPIRKWAFDDIVTPAISACVPVPGAAEHPSAKDGAAIVSMVHSYGDFEYLKAHLLPIICEQISNIRFSLACLTQIILLSQHDGVFPTLETSKICYPDLKAAVANMDVSKLQSQEASNATLAAGRRSFTYTRQELTDLAQASSRRIVSPRPLADLLIVCLRFKWNTMALEFCEKVVSYLSSAPTVDDHSTLWIPFFRRIPPTLKGAKVHISSLARAILESFINKYVGPEPGRIDYSGQGPVSCRCDPCRRLNGFLASKDRVWHFQAVKKDRQHIEEKVSSGFGLSFETIQNLGFPWTLVLTKKQNSAEKLRAAWNEKFKAAQKILGNLNKSKLKEVVGGEKEWGSQAWSISSTRPPS